MASVQEFVRGGGGGGAKSESFFLAFQFFRGGGGPAQKIDEKMIFSTEKVAKYRIKFAPMTFFCFVLLISRGGGHTPCPPPPGHAPGFNPPPSKIQGGYQMNIGII